MSFTSLFREGRPENAEAQHSFENGQQSHVMIAVDRVDTVDDGVI